MTEGFDHGRFQGMVLERLDSLKELGAEVKECLEAHEKRLTLLEHLATRAKVWGVVAGCLAGYLSNKLPLLLGAKLSIAGTSVAHLVAMVWPTKF